MALPPPEDALPPGAAGRRSDPSAGDALLWTIAAGGLYLATGAVTARLLETSAGSLPLGAGTGHVLTILAQAIFFLGGSFLFTRLQGRTVDASTQLGFARARPSAYFVALACLPAILPLSVLFSRLGPGGEASTLRLLPADAGPGAWALAVTALVAAPAVCEEALFRGVLQGGLQRRLGPPWASAASGIVFAFFHLGRPGAAGLLPVGIFLGELFRRSGSLYPCMVFHAAYNGLAIVIALRGHP